MYRDRKRSQSIETKSRLDTDGIVRTDLLVGPKALQAWSKGGCENTTLGLVDFLRALFLPASRRSEKDAARYVVIGGRSR